MKNFSILFILTAVVILGCKKEETTIAIDSKILVELRKDANDNYQIIATTEKTYPYSNYPILFSKTKVGSTITVKFKKISTGETLLPAFGPAKATIDFKNLTKNSYRVKFELNGKTTEGTLTINPMSIKLHGGGNVLEK
tara:strand:- start:64989 stop:65405 length:417 start_codon:yes stop_codon:yes gene_type:complete